MARPTQQSSRPKNTPSAYLVFCSAKRAELQNANPGATFTELGKMFGQIWASFTPEEKQVYIDQANLLKAQNKPEAGGISLSSSAGQEHHALLDVSLGLDEQLVEHQAIE